MARFQSLAGWLAWQEQLHPRPIDLGLDRIKSVYQQLHGQRPLIPTITVAGTNGKGSSVAYLNAIYQAAGYRVGAYTSPHILHYNERIQINGQPVGDDLICDAFERIDQARGEISLSYFEFSTLAALLIFAEAGLDIQILEVGLGGRLDAVNIVDADVAIVTTIGIDHVEWLGNSLEAIAREKAGIFRSGRAAVIADHSASGTLIEAARALGAPIYALGEQYDYVKHGSGWRWHTQQTAAVQLPPPAFAGEHQYRNAAAVVMAVHCLQNRLPVTAEALMEGVAHAHLQGRFQRIEGTIPVLLDVAHNPQAVATLVDYLKQQMADVKIHAIFAMMKDKDIAGVLQLMAQPVSEWYLAPLSNPRAVDENYLLTLFHQQGIQAVHAGYADLSAAVVDARNRARSGELILVFGSFFLVSEYLAQFA